MEKFKDYSNQKFGRLQPLKRLYVKNHKTYWLCKCDCGNIIEKPISYLISGNCKSCGCLSREMAQIKLKEIKGKGNSKSLKDFTGQRFGRLLVLKRVENNKFNQVRWLCRCDCGNEKIVTANSLRNGDTRSCGCLKKEQDYKNIIKVKHNMTNTRLYSIWRGMKSRCSSKNGKKHEFYYDKGIKICDEWKNDFINFYNWAMTNGYKDDLTIDRIDNDGNYEPNNCRWATVTEQNNNQSNNIRIKYEEFEYSLKDLSVKYNIKVSTLNSRLKNGWDIEKALNTPVQKKKKNKEMK